MNKYFWTLSLVCIGFFSTAQVKKPVANTKAKPLAKPIITQPVFKTEIKNGIKLIATGGVLVSKTYLMFEDGSTVPADNTVDINQKIFMVLEIKGGWVAIDSNIQIGASETILSSDGRKILSAADLFKDLKTISIEDSKFITLKAVITNQDKVIPFFTVQFEVWDKQGKGRIKGSYRFKTSWKPE